MVNKAYTPEQGKRPAIIDGQKGYTGHKLPSPAQPSTPTQTPSQSPSGSNPKPSNSDKK